MSFNYPAPRVENVDFYQSGQLDQDKRNALAYVAGEWIKVTVTATATVLSNLTLKHVTWFL